MVMVYGHLDICVLFYLRSTVQYVTFVTNQAEMGNRKEPSDQAIYWALKTTTTFSPHKCTSILSLKGHQSRIRGHLN